MLCVVLEEEHSSFRLLKREKMKALFENYSTTEEEEGSRARDDTLKKRRKTEGESFFCDERSLHAKEVF